jgi:hypothetical protein
MGWLLKFSVKEREEYVLNLLKMNFGKKVSSLGVFKPLSTPLHKFYNFVPYNNLDRAS